MTTDERLRERTGEGVYTGNEINTAFIDDETTATEDTDYGHVVGLQRDEGNIVVTVELSDGTLETIEYPMPEDACLDKDLQTLCESLGISAQGVDDIEGEMVLVNRRTGEITLGDEQPQTEPSTLSTSGLRSLGVVLTAGVAVFLLAVVFLSGVGFLGGIENTLFLGALAQLVLATVLLVNEGVLAG
jgi:hypothetical protein